MLNEWLTDEQRKALIELAQKIALENRLRLTITMDWESLDISLYAPTEVVQGISDSNSYTFKFNADELDDAPPEAS